jgi:2-oxoglutarate dehydrogenase complex dehydrogenase (E1) component-like enzyme
MSPAPKSERRNPTQGGVRRVLLCTGKVFYTLQSAREKEPGQGGVAVIRIEQLYPFPQDALRATVEKYPRVEEIGWVQEEPKNRGAWSFMEPRLRTMFPDNLIAYYGRDEAASPAVGSVKTHQAEEKELVATALGISQRAVPVAKGTPATAVTQTSASQ